MAKEAVPVRSWEMPLLTVLACAEVVPSENDQRTNLYPAFGVAVQVAVPPVCTLVGETFAVPIAPCPEATRAWRVKVRGVK